MLEKVLSANKNIARIVELGTGYGGLTLFFGIQMMARNGKVLSFDIKEKMLSPWHKLARQLPITFKQKDVFDATALQEVKRFISGARSLVFCDNGNKKKELPLYARILKKNDLIMVHDWGIEIGPAELDVKILSILTMYRQDEFDALKTRILSMIRV